MVRPVVGDHVETEPVLEHRLHLTRQQVDRGGCFALVSVTNLEESVPDLAAPSLPDVPQTSLRALAQVSRLSVACFCITLRLVQGVLAR